MHFVSTSVLKSDDGVCAAERRTKEQKDEAEWDYFKDGERFVSEKTVALKNTQTACLEERRAAQASRVQRAHCVAREREAQLDGTGDVDDEEAEPYHGPATLTENEFDFLQAQHRLRLRRSDQQEKDVADFLTERRRGGLERSSDPSSSPVGSGSSLESLQLLQTSSAQRKRTPATPATAATIKATIRVAKKRPSTARAASNSAASELPVGVQSEHAEAATTPTATLGVLRRRPCSEGGTPAVVKARRLQELMIVTNDDSHEQFNGSAVDDRGGMFGKNNGGNSDKAVEVCSSVLARSAVRGAEQHASTDSPNMDKGCGSAFTLHRHPHSTTNSSNSSSFSGVRSNTPNSTNSTNGTSSRFRGSFPDTGQDSNSVPSNVSHNGKHRYRHTKPSAANENEQLAHGFQWNRLPATWDLSWLNGDPSGTGTQRTGRESSEEDGR